MLTFVAYYGELLLKCPKFKRRWIFRRRISPSASPKPQKFTEEDILDVDFEITEANVMRCEKCGYSMRLE